MEGAFDFAGVFDADYLYFYEELLTRERNDAQAELIARLLELEPGLDVLDCPCGHGRIANRLAERGCRVVGLDASQLFLEEARKDAVERGVEVEYVEGDMRELPWTERFDRLLCWFTSFGYFDDETDQRVLEGYRRALRPGGRLLVESGHRDRIVRSRPPGEGDPAFWMKERGDDLMIDRNDFDPVAGRVETERIVVRGGRVRRTRFSVRLHTPTELRERLLRAGFAEVELYGEDGEPFTLEARRMIAVARRP